MLGRITRTCTVFAIFSASLRLSYAATLNRVACPGGKYTALHKECCVFYDLRDDLQANLFENSCGDEAQEALRLTFHDAIGYSKSGKLKGRGADGSIILFEDIETKYIANTGIDDAVQIIKPFLQRYLVTAGDLIQFAGAVGVANCPGAPRLEFLAGRPNATGPADDGTVPSPSLSADDVLARMEDGGFTADDTVRLLASHSVARSAHVDPTVTAPFDSTPFTFDSQFYLEVLLKGSGYTGNGSAANPLEVQSALSAQGEMRLQSDFALAHDARTACSWQAMINNQNLMVTGFRDAMAKLAVTGQNAKNLIDCSDAIPVPKILKKRRSAAYPAGYGQQDVQQSCSQTFPVLQSIHGEPKPIPTSPSSDSSACKKTSYA